MSEAIVRCRNHPEIDQGCRPCSRCGSWFCPNCLVDFSGHSYCASCKVGRLRDLQTGTPSAGGELDFASIGRRFAAVFIDSMLFTIPGLVLFIAVVVIYGIDPKGFEARPTIASTGEAAFWIAYFLFLGTATVGRVIYEGIMLGRRGQTLGKITMSIKVVTPEGNDIRQGQAWNRAILRLALDTCLSLINYLPALFSRDKTAIHDIAAKTRVVNWRV